MRAGAKQSSHSVCKFILNFWIATKIFGVKININKQKSKFFKSLSKDKKIKAIEISSKSKEFGNNGLIGRLKDLFINSKDEFEKLA